MSIYFPGALRIGVVSDSHGNLAALSRIAEALADALTPADGVLHLGDGMADTDWLRKRVPCPVLNVRGNCDLHSSAPAELSGILGGNASAAFYACHGHRLDVKNDLLSLAYRARELGAKVALYGHSHVAWICEEPGLLLVNPGAAKEGRFALLTLEEDIVRAELRKIALR